MSLLHSLFVNVIVWPVKCLRSCYRRRDTKILGITACCFLLIYILQSMFKQQIIYIETYGNRNYPLYDHIEKAQQNYVKMDPLLNQEDIMIGISDVRVKHLLPFHNQKHHTKTPILQEQDDSEPYLLIDDSDTGELFCNIYDLRQPLHIMYDCVPLQLNYEHSTVREIPICLYPIEDDIHISYHIKTTGTWEPHIVKQYQEMLHEDCDIGVIDIGANIGVYSLVAAHMDHQVVAVEPFIINIQHLQQGIQLEKWRRKSFLSKMPFSINVQISI